MAFLSIPVLKKFGVDLEDFEVDSYYQVLEYYGTPSGDIEISTMSDDHLINAIKYFQKQDQSKPAPGYYTGSYHVHLDDYTSPYPDSDFGPLEDEEITVGDLVYSLKYELYSRLVKT